MLVSPSVLSSDFGILKDQVLKCEEAGADSLHLDVMDGHFVPNITFGFDIIKTIRESTRLTLESHLMIDRPDKYYQKFLESGSDIMLLHVESPMNLGELLARMKKDGSRFGIVVNPETPVEHAFPFLEGAEILLVMSVHPGFSGQKFIEDSLVKLKEAKSYIQEHKLHTLLEIDGGINNVTGKRASEAGADILVSGSYVFSGNIMERISSLKRL